MKNPKCGLVCQLKKVLKNWPLTLKLTSYRLTKNFNVFHTSKYPSLDTRLGTQSKMEISNFEP